GARGDVGVLSPIRCPHPEAVRAIREIGDAERGGAILKAAAVELTFEGGAGVVRGEAEGRVRIGLGGAVRGTGGDGDRGRIGVHGEGPPPNGALVAGGVDRLDVEGMGAVRERGTGERRGAGPEWVSIEVAGKGRTRLGRGEGEVWGRVVREAPVGWSRGH